MRWTRAVWKYALGLAVVALGLELAGASRKAEAPALLAFFIPLGALLGDALRAAWRGLTALVRAARRPAAGPPRTAAPAVQQLQPSLPGHLPPAAPPPG